MRFLLLLAAMYLLQAAEPAAVLVGPNPSAVAFFEAKVRPLLTEHCFECHADRKQKSGLRVDSLASLLRGGHDEGPAVVPGDITHGSLLRAISWADSDLQMPPKAKLPEAAIHDLEHWIAIGAPWPDAAAPVASAAPPQAQMPLLGRVHPIVVHLPIACLLLAAFAELLALWRGAIWKPTTALLVAVGALGAVLAVISGLMLEGDQEPLLLQRHELLAWFTLAGALCATALLVIERWVAMRRWPLLVALVMTALLVAATGHVGGQMAWGRDWLPF